MFIGKGKPSWGVDIGAKAGEPAKADICRAAAGGAIAEFHYGHMGIGEACGWRCLKVV